MPPQVICYERADDIGFGVSGVVTRARGIRAAVIIAIDDERHILLVEQFRVPLGRPCIELPAGLIGDHDGQED